jgi:hypothetical protein
MAPAAVRMCGMKKLKRKRIEARRRVGNLRVTIVDFVLQRKTRLAAGATGYT